MDGRAIVSGRRSSLANAPVAPGRLPLVGHAVQLARHPLEFMDGLREHGKVVRIQLGPVPAYVVTDADLTRTVLVTDSKFYAKGGRMVDALRVLLGNGLASVADGDLHRRNRRLMQPMFNRAHIATRRDAMISLVQQLIDAWPENESRAMHDEMSQLSLAAFLVALFGDGLPAAVKAEFPVLLPKIMHGIIRQAVMPGWLASLPIPAQRRYRESLARLRELIDETIDWEPRWQGQDATHTALFSTLVNAQDPETGERLSRSELQDEVITLLTASVETTGTVLAWALYEISRRPDIEQKLLEEIDTACAHRTVRTGDIGSLEYTRRVLHETMRYYGPLWMATRRTTDAVTLGGYRIPGDTDIVFSPYILQHDPAVFADPHGFDPDRWAPDRVHEIPRNSFLAFGAGGRQCIGESFAWVEMVIILAVIVSQRRLTVTSDGAVKPVAHITVQPNHLTMAPHRRSV